MPGRLSVLIVLLLLAAGCGAGEPVQVDVPDQRSPGSDLTAEEDGGALDLVIGEDRSSPVELDVVADSETWNQENREGWLWMVVFDVGQGDSILVKFPEGTTMLVDGGKDWSGKNVVLPGLAGLGVEQLDYVVLTHPHSDHCGGLDEVVKGIEVGEVWENGEENDSCYYFFKAVRDRHVPSRVVERGESEYIDGCQVLVMNSDEGWSDPNSNSVVLRIDCDGSTVLLTGDADDSAQEEMVEVFGQDLAAEVVKVPHHGSKYAFDGFFTAVSPDMAVCSVGADNSFGHPTKTTINRWQEAGAEFLRTDEDGTVRIWMKSPDIYYELVND